MYKARAQGVKQLFDEEAKVVNWKVGDTYSVRGSVALQVMAFEAPVTYLTTMLHKYQVVTRRVSGRVYSCAYAALLLPGSA